MTLQSNDIKCVGGECYTHVFENPRMGVKRGLFWNFFLECAPIIWEGEKWEAALLCDWVTLPVRNWRDMGEIFLGDLPQRDSLEASFYLSAHHFLQLNSLAIAFDRDDLIRVHMGGSLDLEGYGELDGAAITVDVSGSVRFKGLIVVPDNLFPEPSNAASAIAVAQEFLDLDTFTEPIWDGSRFLFEPRLAAGGGPGTPFKL